MPKRALTDEEITEWCILAKKYNVAPSALVYALRTMGIPCSEERVVDFYRILEGQ